MVTENRTMSEHVDEMLSGFVDGELTQQQRQWVTLHCESCDECRDNLERLRELRSRIAGASLSEMGEDRWRESMHEDTVQMTRGLGWILFIAGLLIIAGIGVVQFLFNEGIGIGMKLLIVAVYGGLGLLFFSVLRQRMIERKTDKYKDVEI
jgi:predicted anti-sigma-YlaC factor YlaD